MCAAPTLPADRTRSDGYSFVELLFAVALSVTLASLAGAAVAQGTARLRAEVALRTVVGRFLDARAEAVRRGGVVAIVFSRCDDAWCVEVVADGNGNGVRRAEIASGTDRALERPWTVEDATGVLRVAVTEDLPPLAPGEPAVAAGDDPVRFGSADLVSFSPLGTATSGSILLSGRHSGAFAVRVLGTTGRVRAMAFDPEQRVWRDR